MSVFLYEHGHGHGEVHMYRVVYLDIHGIADDYEETARNNNKTK